MSPADLLPVGLAFAAGFLAMYAFLGPWREPMARFLREKEEACQESLKDIFLTSVSARALVLTKYFGPPVALLGFGFLTGKWVLAVLVSGAVHFGPDFFLKQQRKKRWDRLQEQVVDVISAISTTSRAGLTLQESFQEAATKLEAPASQEMGMLCERLKSGQAMDTALGATDSRIDLPGYSLLVKALTVHRERGGKLGELLEAMADTLRELAKLEEKVRSQTAGIRLAARIMVAMPFVLGGLLYMMDPAQVSVLWTTILGQVVLVIILLMDFVGFLMLRRLAEPDI